MTGSTDRRIRRTRLRREGGNHDVFARTTIIKVERNDDSTSRQLDPIDEWASSAFASIILPPPYNLQDLARIIEQSSSLRPCIEAYTVNTVQTGWEVEPAVRGTEGKPGEIVELQSFIDHSNSDESLSAVMTKVIDDRESYGFGFLEGIRDASGSISLLRHAPAMITRLCPKDQIDVLVEYVIQRGRRVTSVREFKKFRKCVQLVGGRTVFFKEWGDPRRLDRLTGAYEGEEGFTPGNEATELYHFKLLSNEPYGVPRWVTQLPSIIGSREAEEVNMRYFKENTVPPMLLTVSGGRLTQHSFEELTRALSTEGIGASRQNKIMLIEATGDTDSLDKNGTPVKLAVEKLTDARQSDALFAEYDRSNQAKVRMAWRLPGVVVGQGSDENYANAQVSIFMADSQVFGPARVEIEEVLNKKLVHSDKGLALRSVRLVSRVPAISSPENTLKGLTALNVMGAVTPRSAQMVANKVLQMELPSYPEKGQEGYEDWMDKPLSLTKGPSTTHAETQAKTSAIKSTEESGNPGFEAPEHGREGEVITE